MLHHYTVKLEVRIKPVHGIFRNIVRNSNIKYQPQNKGNMTCALDTVLYFL